MCGRFVSGSPPGEIARYFSAEQVDEHVLEPNYNVAPTDDVYVVRESAGVRRLDTFHWGLVPFWAKDPSVGNRMINARSEGLAEKGAFKHAFRHRRCLVPADGFYEWKAVPDQKKKQPFYIHRPDGEPLAFAGLWETWKEAAVADREGGNRASTAPTLRSCTIVTTDANDRLSALHDRMPVILPPAAWDDWLDRNNEDVDALGQLLVPATSELLALHAVGVAVSNVRSAGSELIEPVAVDEAGGPASHGYRQGTLL